MASALSQSQGLVSRDGMIGGGALNDRNGAACRTVEDVAKVLDVIAGYDPADDLTVYSVGRVPKEGYASYARATSLKGIRIGVLREYMDKRLFTRPIMRPSISSNEPLAIFASWRYHR